MGKVSIGLRGWRFDESEVFTDEGEYRPLEEIAAESRHRLVRLNILVGKPCQACYLIHGDGEKRRCNEATIVYGEPLDEVLLCDRHEADFLYWFREAAGRELAGEDGFRDAFHEWFADGGRAPEGYAGVEHVDTHPGALPNPPDPQEVQQRLNEGTDGQRIDFRAGTVEGSVGDGDGADEANDGEEKPQFDDVDLSADYPTR